LLTVVPVITAKSFRVVLAITTRGDGVTTAAAGQKLDDHVAEAEAIEAVDDGVADAAGGGTVAEADGQPAVHVQLHESTYGPKSAEPKPAGA
jgi:hypothetical protein